MFVVCMFLNGCTCMYVYVEDHGLRSGSFSVGVDLIVETSLLMNSKFMDRIRLVGQCAAGIHYL